jgi:Trk K+ transport system NAD-binding subunit
MRIIALKDNGNMVTDEDGINLVATKYFRDLFGPPTLCSIAINELLMEKLEHEDRHFLTAAFSMEETKMVVDNLKQNNSPSPDAISKLTYTTCFKTSLWEILP